MASMFDSFALWFLMTLTSLSGVDSIPQDNSSIWLITISWENQSGLYVFEAKSTAIIQSCRSNPNANIEFPNVIQELTKFSSTTS
jgi:hypothetical protein